MHHFRQGRHDPARGTLVRRALSRRAAPPTKASLEKLEDRRLFANTVVISEFLAINDSGLRDEDGTRSDWIELYNPTASDVNLDGYFLTDNANDLDQWRLPAVTLRSNDYLLVWASGKDRKVAGSPLHTNFNLDGALGEYLALVAPDATTRLTEFNPFPAQSADISYGVTAAQTTTPLINPRHTARVRVPTAADNLTAWLQPTFNDSSWIPGVTGVGYETDSPPPPTPGFRVRMVDVNPGARPEITSIDEAVSILNGTSGANYTLQTDTTVGKTVINMGSGGAYGGDQALPTGAATADLYALRATSAVTIPAGDWTINVNSDDGFRLRIPGVTFLTPNNGELVAADTFQFSQPRGPANSFVTFTVPAGGLTATLQLDFYENGGGDSVELSVASGHRASFSTATFTLLGNNVLNWAAADPTTVGPLNYRALIGTDVQQQMLDVNASAFVRVPFSVANANDFDTLRLQMKYDDGFVAYLNGTEVARRNAPGAAGTSLPFDAQATASRDENQAVVYESISIDSAALRTGSNVLAIRALNAAANSSDLLVYPELQGFRSTLGVDPRFFPTPTPLAPNTTPSAIGVVADTKFSVDRGFYDTPQTLAITTATEGAEIRYTTDGTQPTATTGLLYTGPITLDRTTTLRAAAFKAGFVPSNVDTQTYLFLDDVIRQPEGIRPGPDWPLPTTNGQWIDYGMDQGVVNANIATIKNDLKSIPTISIVMKTGDLFDPTTGIYTHPREDGRAWERPASVELINPDGSDGFQIDAGIRVRGGFSRDPSNPKHAFRLFFRNEYDGDLDYPMFGPDGSQEFDGFDLRTFQNYSWSFQNDSRGTFMRDQVNRDIQLAMGQDAERGKYAHLYINGHYWGLFNPVERPEANHGANYFGGDADDYDVIKVDPDLGYNIEATDGNLDAWNQLYSLLTGPSGSATEAVLQRVMGNNPDGTRNPAFPVLLDVDNLIDYMLVIYWGGNRDAPISDFLGNQSPNNFFALRNRNGDEGFRFYVHDAEHTMLPWDGAAFNRLGPNNQPGVGWFAGAQGVNKSNPQYFFQQLWHLPNFKTRVADRVQKHMVNPGGVLTTAKVSEMMALRKAEIDRAVVAESARWGDAKRSTPYTRDTWLAAVAQTETWAASRTSAVIDQLRLWGLLPSFYGPRFLPQGGQVQLGSTVTMLTNGSSPPPAGAQIYYTTDGSDPRRPDGTLSPTALLYSDASKPVVNDTTTIRARIRSGSNWSGMNVATFSIDLAAIRVTEVMYHPAPPPAGSPYVEDDFEFIEIMNTGPTERNLTGVTISGINFAFPNDFRLAAGARAVVVKNRAAFESRYGTTFNGQPINFVPGVFTGQLDNGGEELRIISATGQNSLVFTYDDDWYPQTDGEGFSLHIIDPTVPFAAFSLKSSWTSSNRVGGTPGAPNDALPAGVVIVNEVLANPEFGSPTGDFIELRNTTNAPINLSGWFLSDSALNPRKFRIPDGTLVAANGYVVFHQAQLGFDMLPAPGEVFLTAAAGDELLGYRESKRFGLNLDGYSFGEHVKSTGGTDFVAMQSPTPGAPNGPALVGPVVISELMYHPPGFAMEYIELRNLTGSDVVLHEPGNPISAWNFVDGISYTFPEGARVPAFGFALLIAGDEATFRSLYSIPANVPVYGPFQPAGSTNNLLDAGENLTLYRPSPRGDVLVDRVNYTSSPPWPNTASGSGRSIGRVTAAAYGNDAANWRAEKVSGTPGRVNFDSAAPSADVVDVAPDPRTAPVDTITIVFSEAVRGFTTAALSLRRDGGANLLTGAQTLGSADGVTWTLTGLTPLTTPGGSYTLTLTAAGSGVTDFDNNALATDASEVWRMGAAPGLVMGRHVFYNASTFDGGAAGTPAQDDAAVATNKRALRPGDGAGFDNYTSYSRGLNGIMVDIANLPAGSVLSAADFEFKVGNDADFSSWTAAPAPLAVTRRAGAGVSGSDRVTLRWADGAITNQWLRVTVLPNGRTGLATADVFYFGNLVGEIGDSNNAAAVTAADVMAVRAALTQTNVPVTHALDFNRDRRVNTLDLAIARGAVSNGSLTLLTAPQPPAAAATAAGTTTASTTTATTTASTSTTVQSSTTQPASAPTVTTTPTAVSTAPAPVPAGSPNASPAAGTASGGDTVPPSRPASRGRPVRRSILGEDNDILARS